MPSDDHAILNLILNNQNNLESKFDTVIDKVLDRLDAHNRQDTESFQSVRDVINTGLGGLRDRITRVEMVSDTVDSLTDTAMDHEHRIKTIEFLDSKESGAIEARRAASSWVQWLITVLVALSAALAAWAFKH